jgi:hypothetical protein
MHRPSHRARPGLRPRRCRQPAAIGVLTVMSPLHAFAERRFRAEAPRLRHRALTRTPREQEGPCAGFQARPATAHTTAARTALGQFGPQRKPQAILPRQQKWGVWCAPPRLRRLCCLLPCHRKMHRVRLYRTHRTAAITGRELDIAGISHRLPITSYRAILYRHQRDVFFARPYEL